MRRLILAATLLPCLAFALPGAALAQSGTRAPTSSGVVSGQGWNTGQDLHRNSDTARRRAEAQRRAPNRAYTGLPTRTRGLPGRPPGQTTASPAPASQAQPASPPAR